MGRTRPMGAVAIALAGLVVGCGPTVTSPPAGDSSTTASASGSTAVSLDTTTTTTTVTGAVDTTSTGTTTDGGESTTGDLLCEVIPAESSWQVVIDNNPRVDQPVDLDETCVLANASGDPGFSDFLFQCATGEYTVSVYSLPPVELTGLNQGDSYHVRAVANSDFADWPEDHVAVFDTNGELVAASLDVGILPVDTDTFFSPLTFDVARGLCPAIPYEAPINFIDGSCPGDREVLALDFADGNEQVRIYDGDRGTLGALDLLVMSAVHTIPEDGASCRSDGRPFDRLIWTALRLQ